MGKIRDFFFGEERAEFSSSDLDIVDGEIITSVDQRIRYLFSPNGVTRDSAMTLPAVTRGRNMICNISTLPLVMYDKRNNAVTDPRLNSLINQISPNFVPNVVTLSALVEDMVFEGGGYLLVDKVAPRTLYPTKAHHVPFGSVTEQDGEYWVDGEKVHPDAIIYVPSPNPALLKVMSGIIQRAIATARTSEMYARNPMPKLLFSPKADVDPDAEATRDAIQNFADSSADSPYNYVGAALDAKPLEFITPADLQLVDIEKNIERGVANFFGMDAQDLGLPGNDGDYNNGVDRRKGRINDVLNPYIQAIEQRLSMGDVTPTGYFVRFNQDDYLRADPLVRAQVDEIRLRTGTTTKDEVRAKEGLPPMTAEQKSELTQQLAKPSIEASFSADSEAAFSFESAEFSEVDQENWTIKVLAVPYGELSSIKGGRKYVFTKGSLNYPENLKKVKLLRDHDYTQSVGYATNIEETDKGLVVTFQVSRTDEGKKALAGFADGTYDGASVGVDFDENGIFTQQGKPGIYYVRSARLKEVSQVSIPAFESAGVTASRGDEMTDNLDGAVNEASEKTYTVAEFAAMQSMFSKPTEAAAPANEIPVRDAFKANDQEKPVATTFVSEPGPYRFDGNQGNYEFSADLISLSKHDDPAIRQRLNDFMSADFAVSTTNAATLNPTVQRPDMYVGQMDIRTPIMDAIYKGAPSNGVTPFSFPKYNSSSTLVSDHTEGTEPTLGAYSVTNQTVTPTALSGKIEINREAWDQGGSPALSQLIRTEMHRAYNEGLETSAATFLDGLTLTGKEITITTAAADSVLEGLMIDALVALQGDRGGQYLTEFLSHVDLYKALVKAKDSAGRRLFPAVGPNNATGTVSSKFASLDMNGYAVKYAPALGATGTVAEYSYLLDPAKVYAWATTPQDLTFDIQVKSIYLGIWGYKAFALRDINGIRRFIFDPA